MESSYRILIVDDVALLRTIAKNYFNRNEYQLTTARSVTEALRVATAIHPHLIIMDAEMPEQDGLAGCRLIKNNPALFTIPVILVANDVGETIEQCWQAGCDAVLPRPLSRRELVSVAKKLLELADRATPRIDHHVLINYGRNDVLEWHDYAINVGNGGFYVATENTLEVGTRLQFELIIPGAKGPTRCQGRIAWQNTKGKNLRPDLPAGFGVEFIDLGRPARKELQKFVLDGSRRIPMANRKTSEGENEDPA